MSPAAILSRVAASLLGSYAFAWGFVSLGVVLGVAAGLAYEEALTLTYLLAFLVMLVCFCWAFVGRSLLSVWGLLAGGGALLTTVAWLLSGVLTSS
ncbi:MAG TPA: hypothetical protein VKZ49_12230 [Polyangiaceae bacterium]|nr:hypothetical protein [Polyangiaceae bacterium]